MEVVMKYAIRYQSRGGNTRAVAETIAEILGIKAESIDIPLEENVDILFLGGGVYKWTSDKKLKEFLENINPEIIGKIIPFGTSGGQKIVIKEIQKFAEKRGIKVDEKNLYIQMWLKGHSVFGLKGGNLSSEQITQIKEFMEGIIKE
jgi:flavodoxin